VKQQFSLNFLMTFLLGVTPNPLTTFLVALYTLNSKTFTSMGSFTAFWYDSSCTPIYQAFHYK